MNTITELVERSRNFDQTKWDYPIATPQATWNDDGTLTVPGGFVGPDTLQVNDWALNDAANKLDVPISYLGRCPTDLRATNLNHWTQQKTRKGWLVRANNGTARAILDKNYRVVDNTQILQLVADFIDGAGVEYKLIRPYVGPDSMHLKISVADVPGGNYAIGAYVGNGEIGNYKARVLPFIQRHSCTNSIVIQKGGFELRHFGNISDGYLRNSIKEALGQAMQMSPVYLNQIAAAEEDNIPDVGLVIERLCQKSGFTKHTARIATSGSEGMQNRAGVIHGLSYAAHADKDLRDDERADLEILAGAILAEPGSLFGEAKKYAERELDKRPKAFALR